MNCYCAICHEILADGQAIVDHPVYELDGSLDYIELAHATCGDAHRVTTGYPWSVACGMASDATFDVPDADAALGADEDQEFEDYEDPMQADAQWLASAGMGTDEDYGVFSEYQDGW